MNFPEALHKAAATIREYANSLKEPTQEKTAENNIHMFIDVDELKEMAENG
jgi:hypothetical protein